MSGGDKELKLFNPNYYDVNELIKRNVENKKFLDKTKRELRDRMVKVRANGKTYESIIAAANDIGCSNNIILKHLKALNKTQMSKIEVGILVRKTFVFEKINDKNGQVDKNT